ncbi:hypothetical protein Pelo_12880 [Pelomyxa schiedti]|nr:hypothetical protein Pelo_12880 [Pelomyxa schiedti]
MSDDEAARATKTDDEESGSDNRDGPDHQQNVAAAAAATTAATTAGVVARPPPRRRRSGHHHHHHPSSSASSSPRSASSSSGGGGGKSNSSGSSGGNRRSQGAPKVLDGRVNAKDKDEDEDEEDVPQSAPVTKLASPSSSSSSCGGGGGGGGGEGGTGTDAAVVVVVSGGGGGGGGSGATQSRTDAHAATNTTTAAAAAAAVPATSSSSSSRVPSLTAASVKSGTTPRASPLSGSCAIGTAGEVDTAKMTSSSTSIVVSSNAAAAGTPVMAPATSSPMTARGTPLTAREREEGLETVLNIMDPVQKKIAEKIVAHCEKLTLKSFAAMTTRKLFDKQIETYIWIPGKKYAASENKMDLSGEEQTILFTQLRNHTLGKEVEDFCQMLAMCQFHPSVVKACRENKITENAVKTMEIDDLTDLQFESDSPIKYGDANRIKTIVAATQTSSRVHQDDYQQIKITVEQLKVKLMEVDESYNKFQVTVSMRMSWQSQHEINMPKDKNITEWTVVPETVWLPPLTFQNLSSQDSFSVIYHSVTIDARDTEIEKQQTLKKDKRNNDNHNPLVKYKWKAQGEFSKVLQLQHFPLDKHQFEMALWPLSTTAFTPKFERLNPIDDGCTQDYQSFGTKTHPSATPECEDWDVYHSTIFYSPSQYVEGIQITAQRKTAYYIWNCLVPMFCIVAAGFVVFVEKEASSIFSRFEASAAIVAAVVFFKFSTGVTVCKTQYLTYMDLYLLAAFLVTFGLIVGHCISAVLELGISYTNVTDDSLPAASVIVDYIFSIGFAVLWTGLHLFVSIAVILYRNRGPPAPLPPLDQKKEERRKRDEERKAAAAKKAADAAKS